MPNDGALRQLFTNLSQLKIARAPLAHVVDRIRSLHLIRRVCVHR